ncbi:MAG: SDR family NAD(P)-dependent oxidoreductase, partial [Gaiellales bacterium]
VGKVARELGPPAILVSGAGIAHHRARVEKYDYDAWDLTMEINLSGTFRMLRACAPHLFATRGAALIISSTTALKALPRLTAYGATKAGLVHLTRTVAREWAERGVRVNALCPGYVRTELTRAFLETEHLRGEVLADTPMGRLPEMHEIVEPGLFLLSDEASFITGVALPVDGGMAT